MPQKTIIELTEIDELSEDTVIPCDDGVQTYKGTGAQVRAFIQGDAVLRSLIRAEARGALAAAGSVSTTDDVVIFDATTASFTATLAAASSVLGKKYVFKKSRLDTTFNQVTFSELIDGVIKTLDVQSETMTILATSSGWEMLSRSSPQRPIAYTPTLNSNTSVAANVAYWRKQGRYAVIEAQLRYSGAGNNSTFTASLPGSLACDDTNFGFSDTLFRSVGSWSWYDASGSAASRGGLVRFDPGTSLSALRFTRNDDSNNVNSSAFAANDRIFFQATIPISGWTD